MEATDLFRPHSKFWDRAKFFIASPQERHTMSGTEGERSMAGVEGVQR